MTHEGSEKRAIVGVILLLIALFFSGMGVGSIVAEQKPQLVPGPAPRITPKPYTLPLAYAEWVIYYCDESGVPVWLAARLFSWESGWLATRIHVNDDGSRDLGIAQIHERNIAAFTAIYNDGRPLDPFDAETSIRVGIRYLAALHARLGDWRESIRRYAGNRPPSHTRAIMGDA